MGRLRRKVDNYLMEWKNSANKMPLIVRGARQIGKTDAIRNFGSSYKYFVEINFILENQYMDIFDDGYKVDNILKKITMHNPNLIIEPNETLLFFDEIQRCPNAATSLKAFREDGRFDVVCSGSLMGINYEEIESNSVGNKIDYTMYSMDFEEFLWAKGYRDEQIEDLYNSMKRVEPLSEGTFKIFSDIFKEYMVVGGMPAIVNTFVTNNNYSGILDMQRQIIKDYEEDITKYAGGLDKKKILSVYRKIPVFLGKDNKKFQISKVGVNAKSRDYVGVVDWLKDAGIINVCHLLTSLDLPLKGNYSPDNFKLYFGDNGLLIGTLDEEAQYDLRNNLNFNTYKGAIYENVVGDMLVKSGYDLFFYRNEKSTVELDFIVRDIDSLVPIEVKANDNSTPSLNNVIDKCSMVKYGIKFCNKNIGFNGKFYTFPYFMAFMLKRFLKEKDSLD